MPKVVINPFRYTQDFKAGEKIAICLPIEDVPEAHLGEIGFSLPLQINESVVPTYGLNQKTIDNCDGEIVLRKDLPLEPYYVETPYTVTDWGGYEHSGVNYIRRERYQREYKDAFNISLSICKAKDKLYVSAPPITLSEENKEKIKFTMNLMLSLFGDFVVLTNLFESAPKILRKNYEILRPGTKSPSEMKRILGEISGSDNSKEYASFLYGRMLHLLQYSVDETITVGTQGFRGYYAIKTKKYFVLECCYTGNATYLFGLDQDWESITRFTKQEVILGSLCKKRIYHNKSWKRSISAEMV